MSRCRDRGEANALGLVLIAPLAISLAILILWIGRKVDADAQVQAASSAAAQAAARQRNPVAAVDAARSTAALMLTDLTACSGAPAVSIDVSQFVPGGEVTVTVACAPQRADLLLASPGFVTISASSTASIDTYRAADLP